MSSSVKVSVLKTPADFTELLDLQDLMTQAAVLDHLQKNQRNYQVAFVESFVKTKDEVVEYIPEGHWNKYRIVKIEERKTFDVRYGREEYFNKSDWKGIPRIDYDLMSKWAQNETSIKFRGCKILQSSEDFLTRCKDETRFLVDTINRVITVVPAIDEKHTIEIKDGTLTFKFKASKSINVSSHYRCRYYYGMHYSFKYVFDLSKNLFITSKFTFNVDHENTIDKW